MADEQENPRALGQLLARSRYCERCQAIKNDGPGHKSRSQHPYRALSAAERQQVEKDFWASCEGGPDARKAQVAEKLALQKEAHKQRRVEETASKPIYTVDFGKHKGKTLETIKRVDPGYLSWSVMSKIHETRPSFKAALEDAELLLWATAEAEQLKLQMAEKQHKHSE